MDEWAVNSHEELVKKVFDTYGEQWQIEGVDNYVEKFNELEVLVRSFLADAESQPPNIPNTDRLNRLKNIRDDLNVYKNAYANYAVGLLSKEGD